MEDIILDVLKAKSEEAQIAHDGELVEAIVKLFCQSYPDGFSINDVERVTQSVIATVRAIQIRLNWRE